MSIWFTIPLEAGIIAAVIALIRHSRLTHVGRSCTDRCSAGHSRRLLDCRPSCPRPMRS